MFGMRHRGPDFWAGGRHRRGRWGHGFGRGAMHGMGGGEFMRARRMLAQSDLRLIALALIAEQPRHGYEIIKQLEERTAGWYSPSPGIVYPSLTYLEEAGHLTSQADGAKKLSTITDAGRAYLEENRELVDAVMSRLAYIGKRAEHILRRFGEDAEESRAPRLVEGALENLREAAAKRLRDDPKSEMEIVQALVRAAEALQQKD